MSAKIKIDYRDLKKVEKSAINASKAQSSALKSAGYNLKQTIKTGMQAQAPAGEVWPRAHPWTALGSLRGRYVKRTRRWGRTSMTWTERRRGGAKPLKGAKKPLAKLANAVRYAKQEAGALAAGTTAEADSLRTLCYVDGEYLAYRDATLTGANKYDLDYLVRGAYGSEIAEHLTGSDFIRLDEAIFKYEFQSGEVGSTIWIKLQSFNSFGKRLQSLADVTAYEYTITSPGNPLNDVYPVGVIIFAEADPATLELPGT